MEPEPCPSCHATTTIAGAMHTYNTVPAKNFNPNYSTYGIYGGDGIPKLEGPMFRCCMSCGLVWSRVNPRQLRDFVDSRGDMLTKQDAGLLPPDPVIDLSVSSPGASDALRQVDEIDALIRADNYQLAESRLKDLIGGSRRKWAGALYSWRKLTRKEKLARLGWRLKPLGKEDGAESAVHPLHDRELDD